VVGDIMASATWTTSDKKDKEWDDDDDTTASYDFVRFSLADIHGISRSKLIPRRHVADRLQTSITMCSRMSASLSTYGSVTVIG